MKISAIVACTPNGVIGKNETIPWWFPEDMKRFKEITTGHPVIMGRKTYESLGSRALHGRHTIVVTQKKIEKEDIYPATDLKSAIEIARATGNDTCFLIGGQRIYEEGLPLCDEVHLTKIHMHIPDGEAFFPIRQLEINFYCVESKKLNAFVEFTRWLPNPK